MDQTRRIKLSRLGLLLLSSPLFICTSIVAQTINGYAQVTSVAGATLNLSSVDEAGDSFEDGEQIIIMQMQDDVIGDNINNNANFGLLESISSAGLYEVRTIISHTEASGVPSSITLDAPPSNTYQTGSNSSLQLISFPQFGSPDHTMGNASAKAWNGSTGGVLAFEVLGTLTVGGDIRVDNSGFRGGAADWGSSAGCSGGSSFRTAQHQYRGDKGEGIYKATNTNYAAGHARILSGGGGGNSHNAGGGGGGNYTAGGLGGAGWPNCSPSAGGMGGLDLSAQIGISRIFAGGGGGSGEANNGGSVKAGDGGGIILIKAERIITLGSCSGYSISANGESITTGSGNDGNSAGGAGGSIVFQVEIWNIAASCPLTIEANGGDGGDVTHNGFHGGGGGGGQGLISFSGTQPTNTTANTNNGTGGLNCTGCSQAGSGTGTNGSGVLQNLPSPLPIELIQFEAIVLSQKAVLLRWTTASEKNNDHFTIERSIDAFTWEFVDRIPGAGTSSNVLHYQTTDSKPYTGVSYYRLKQTDSDGKFSFGPVRSVSIEEQGWLDAFPNPTGDFLNIPHDDPANAVLIIVDSRGREMRIIRDDYGDIIRLNVSDYAPGTYLLYMENKKSFDAQIIIKL